MKTKLENLFYKVEDGRVKIGAFDKKSGKIVVFEDGEECIKTAIFKPLIKFDTNSVWAVVELRQEGQKPFFAGKQIGRFVNWVDNKMILELQKSLQDVIDQRFVEEKEF